MSARVYLDHAATTPVVPAAIEAMTAELSRVGNASSLHHSGRAARRVVEESRERITACVGASPAELIFTSGGTESDNLAVKGAVLAARKPARPVVISSPTEHHAVLDSLLWMGSRGEADVVVVAVDQCGRIDLEDYRRVLEEYGQRIALITLMAANNETGVLTRPESVVALGRPTGALLHSDVVQSVGHVPFDFAATGLDAASFTAHKLGGPYGVGALLLRREARLAATQHGGGQERDLRSGTLDVAAIAGFAAAVAEATTTQSSESIRLAALRDELVERVLATVPESRLNGPPPGATDRLPGIANLEFAGADADALLMLLDRAGLDCSTGSACTAGLAQPSHVLLAMGRTEREARSAIRFSLGHTSTGNDVDVLLAALPEAVARARTAASLS